MVTEQDLIYLKKALENASASRDPSTQNGSLLIALDGTAIDGANNFPIGVKDSAERWNDRNMKYRLVVHSERWPIFEAAKQGIATSGATLYVAYYACEECAKAIVAAGIKRVVGLPHANDAVSLRWKDSCALGDIILNEGSVERVYIDHFFDVALRRDGKLVKV